MDFTFITELLLNIQKKCVWSVENVLQDFNKNIVIKWYNISYGSLYYDDREEEKRTERKIKDNLYDLVIVL